MWKYLVETSKSNHKYKLAYNNQKLTYLQVIELWRDNYNFRVFFSSLLSSNNFAAYFWETPPITLSTVNREFEFVLVDSPQLAKANSNLNPFRKYFKSAVSDEQIITFPNLRGDALLVVPCPVKKHQIYAHLASFIRKAPDSQNHALWQSLSQAITQKLDAEPLWISTSGLGVYWLHIRLDSYPKYYHHKPYKIVG